MARLIVSGKVDEIYRGLYKTFSTYGLTAPSNTITQVWTGQREYRLCPPRELIQPELDAPSIEIKPHRSLLNFIRSKISKKDRFQTEICIDNTFMDNLPPKQKMI